MDPSGLYMASPSPTATHVGLPQTPTFFSNGTGAPVSAAVFNPGQPASSDDGGSEAKRRRISRACDQCRKKKIKCDGKQPACTHCVNYKTECVFTHVEKKRNPPKGAKYIEGLENRLGRMESLLKLSGLLKGDEKTDLGDLERRLQESQNPSIRNGPAARSSSESLRATPSSSLQSAENSPQTGEKPEEEDVEALSDQMCSLVTNNCGETRFIGSSSGFSIFSPKGIQWVNEKTGDKSFQQMIMDATADNPKKQAMWGPDIFGELFEKRGRNPMPAKTVASQLVQDFFAGFNVLFPLFHKESFMVQFEKQHSDHPPRDSGWYAAYNMVLAIACRLRISHCPGGHDDVSIAQHIQTGWLYFQNAACVLTELLLRNTDLMSIQAILAMALFMQGTANPQPSYFLIAAAVRIATSIGMHRRGNSFGLSPLEVEQRRRIFWILYLLDKDIALRSGRPPCINDDDCNVELPDEDPSDGIGNVPLKDGKGKWNLFRAMMKFAVISSKVYMQLYSAKAGKQSDGELLSTIGELDRELEAWKDSIPAEYRPENEIDVEARGVLVLHVVVLHFAYYNCLTTIHRMSIHHGYWTSRLANYAIAGLSARPLNPRVFSSAALCVAAARASIHLIKHLNTKDYPCIWLVMYYPVSSLVTIFANILQNPQDPRARTDLRLMNAVVEFLSMVRSADEFSGGKFEDGSVNRMLVVCGEFERIAKLVLDKADRDFATRKKRKQQSDPDDSMTPAARRNPSTSTATPMTPRNSQPMTPASGSMEMGGVSGPGGEPIFTGDMNTPFSPNSLSWLNDINTPGHLASPPPVTENPSMPMVSANSFEQPFVPQDLWSMPMTFEWDWADVNPPMAWEAETPQPHA